MDQSRILLIGQAGPFRTSRFEDPPNLAEFSAVIWYPKSINVEWQQVGARSTAALTSNLIEWVKKGNTLAIVGAPGNLTANYIKNSSQHKIDLLKTEIFEGINFRQTSGFLMEYVGPKSLAEGLSPLVSWLSYDAILNSNDFTPLFRVSTALNGEDQIVGAYKKLGDGIVVFVPPLTSAKIQSVEFYAYHLQIASILETLKSPTDFDHPGWLDNFQTRKEQELIGEISNRQALLRDLDAQIVGFQNDRTAERLNKNLFTSTGDAFSNAVADAFRELGFGVVDGPKQRADLIVWDGARLAALEVKGLEGGAREKNIGQVKRWTADVSVALSSMPDEVTADTEIVAYQAKLAELGVSTSQSGEPLDCKGIVVLNTFRKIPINERPEAYGEPVTKVIVRSGVCALTGLQLFLILRDIRAHPSRKGEIADKLFSTNGSLDEGLSWESHLLHKPNP